MAVLNRLIKNSSGAFNTNKTPKATKANPTKMVPKKCKYRTLPKNIIINAVTMIIIDVEILSINTKNATTNVTPIAGKNPFLKSAMTS